DPWIHPNLLLDPAKGGGRGEKGDLRRSAVAAGSRRRQVLQLDHTFLLLAAAVHWMAMELGPFELERWLSSRESTGGGRSWASYLLLWQLPPM
uniref:Uncharacterized protein n=1 Tax=Aegilops tauschii subsp. strangulata TaxID=200361 RepID=A0A452Y5Y9_AEGTS